LYDLFTLNEGTSDKTETSLFLQEQIQKLK